MADDWGRLATHVVRRRNELGYQSQAALAAELRVNPRTVWSIEQGKPVRAGTAAKLERALGWAVGSVDDIVAGGEPRLVGQAPSSVAEPAWEQSVPQEVVDNPNLMTPEQAMRILDQVRRLAVSLGNPDPFWDVLYGLADKRRQTPR